MVVLEAPVDGEEVLSLEIPPRPEFVAVVRLVVATAAKSRRLLSDDRVDDLRLAVSEACTNAIEAHLDDAPELSVLVAVHETDERVVVTVVDQGPGFDPESLPTHPPVTDPKRLNFERGLGIPLIRTLVDEVDFHSDGAGTTVRMVVLCAPAPEPIEIDDIDLSDLMDDPDPLDEPG